MTAIPARDGALIRVTPEPDARHGPGHHDAFQQLVHAFLEERRAQLHFEFDKAMQFRGSIKSGAIGALRYLRSSVSHGDCEVNYLFDDPQHHEMLLFISGVAKVEIPTRSLKAAAGDIVMVGRVDRLRLSFESPTEFIVLKKPLDCRRTLASLNEEGLARRSQRSEGVKVLLCWLQYVCAERSWVSPEAMASASQVIRSLSGEVLHERSAAPATRPDRSLIERHIASMLGDPSLSMATLAERCGCSVRTLHRVFRREGDESIERYIQRCRIEACAALLRESARADARSLTELAMQFGFASSSHFSTVFRNHFGVSPSAYRQQFQRAPGMHGRGGCLPLAA
jgi:AraC family transcriptional regulator, positive regulator of tynA and feaB